MTFDAIIVASVPHTGNASIVKLFDKKEYQHIALEALSEGLDVIDETKINLITGHIWPKTIDVIKYLNGKHQVIIPMRDPLLSLISTKIRNVSQNINTIFDLFQYSDTKSNRPKIKELKPLTQNIKGGDMSREVKVKKPGIIESEHIKASNRGMRRQLLSWELWAKHIYNINPFHVPLDLGVSDLVYRDVNFKNIGIHNSKGDYELKRAYYDKDLLYIASELNDNLGSLIKMEPILRPPLEKLGYRNLLWWNYKG